MKNKVKRTLSAIQPTGEMQLGNYLGAVRRWIDLQNSSSGDHFYFVVDLHSLTVMPDALRLREQTLRNCALLFACGLDPNRSTFFLQSHVGAHAEACWLLNCVTPIGWLEKMTQFKDKSSRLESVSTGLLDYPVLMAADILLYDSDQVPVGEDQKQHVELARNIAERFNHIYGETFVVPEPVIPELGARIRGLDNPLAKMSKSLAHMKGHSVNLLDSPEQILATFKTAKTDSGREIRFSEDPEKAGVDNLLTIYRVLTGKTSEQVEADFANARGYGDLKVRVAEVVIESLRPIRERYQEIAADRAELERLLAIGAKRARELAYAKLDLMKERMGLVMP
jgi:tryptophanyl-tRNA synthetase